MLRNWIWANIRNLLRNKSYTLINILGLALGISCSLVIFLLVKYDLSFDNFQPNAERIYRVTTINGRGDDHSSGTPFPIAEALPNDFPEIEKVVQTLYEWEGLLTIYDGDGEVVRYQEDNGVAFVEQEFLNVFYHQWLSGDPNRALQERNSVVLTETMAKKYFPDSSPLGKHIKFNNELDLNVTGVIKDLPANTNFPFKILISYTSLKGYQDAYDRQSWHQIQSNHQTYVLLPENRSPEQIEARFPAFMQKYLGESTATNRDKYALQPLFDIHYDIKSDNYNEQTVRKETIWALVLIAIFLIGTACINFMNLATAQAVRRSKEVGIRKVVGSSRGQLIWQFLSEAAIITVLAAGVSLALAELFLQQLPLLIGLNSETNQSVDSSALLFIGLTTGLVVILAGFYPALVISRLNPVHALRNKITSSNTGHMFIRKGLVTLQFVISQMLIIGTLVIQAQMNYFQNKPLGFAKDAIITTPLPTNEKSKLRALRNRLLQNPDIEKLSFAIGTPTAENIAETHFTYEGYTGDKRLLIEIKAVDEHYIDTYKLNLLAGRELAERDAGQNIVVNEAAVRKMGMVNSDDAIGKTIKYSKKVRTIVGVVQDFHTRSLHTGIDACMLAYRPQYFYQAGLRIHTQNMKFVLEYIEQAWTETYPEHIFRYDFLDETIKSFYEEEQRVAGLVKLFSGIAIFIGCLGLYGLVSFMVNQKTKEVGIRKVLSASVFSIVLLFTKEFAKMLTLAFVIAAPIAYVVLNSWLQNFVYRIQIGPVVFALAALITFIVAAMAVGYKSIKAAIANPVDSLRYE